MCQFHPHLAKALIAERQYRQDEHGRRQARQARQVDSRRDAAAVAHERQRAFVLASLVWSRKDGEPR